MRDLYKNLKGEDVKQLQRWLKQRGYYSGKIDGDFGKYTQIAVINYQKKMGLKPDGIVGPITRRTMGWESGNTHPDPQIKLTPQPKELTPKQKLEKITGSFNTASELYTQISKFKYSFYYNDQYNNQRARERLSNGLGLNCTDYAQLLKPVIEEMGYQTDYVHGKIFCGKNWYGHVWLKIKGREHNYWTYFDAVAVTHSGTKRPLGQLCCVDGIKDVEVNPKWLTG